MIYRSSLAWLTVVFLALQPVALLADPAPPDVTLSAHKSPALAVAFSPDGTLLASVADDGLLKLWDIANKKEAFSFEGLKGNHNDVRFTPDGQTIVALGSNNDVVLLGVKTGKALKSIAITDLPGGATALDLSPDGKTIAIVGYGALRLFDRSSGELKKQYQVHAEHGVAGVAFSRDGDRIATVGADHLALVLEASTGKTLHKFDLELPGEAVAFSGDGKMLVTYAERVVRSFDIESGKMQKLVDKGYPFRTMAVSPDGKSLILGGAGRGPWLVTIADGTISSDLYGGDDRINCAVSSPDGKWLAGGGNEGPFYLWKITH